MQASRYFTFTAIGGSLRHYQPPQQRLHNSYKMNSFVAGSSSSTRGSSLDRRRRLNQRWVRTLPAILAFREDLARRGIRLVVIPMPGKPSVYPEKLTWRTGFSSPTRDLIVRLREAGVETPDLFEIFETKPPGGSYYLSRDTHWSGDAARIAAEVVARRIRHLGWADPGSTEYDAKPVWVKRRGDIMRMMRAPQLEQRFPPERVRCEQVIRRDTGEFYQDDPIRRCLSWATASCASTRGMNRVPPDLSLTWRASCIARSRRS